MKRLKQLKSNRGVRLSEQNCYGSHANLETKSSKCENVASSSTKNDEQCDICRTTITTITIYVVFSKTVGQTVTAVERSEYEFFVEFDDANL